MALKKTITLPNGDVMEDCYMRINSVAVVDKIVLQFTLGFHKSPEFVAKDFKEYSSSYSLAEEDPYAPAYRYLKTLPEFADAVDC